MKEVLTLAEASEYLRVTKATVYKFAQQGDLPGFKVGKIWRFKRNEFEAWVDEHRNNKRHRKRKR